jgi:hypothetical protein
MGAERVTHVSVLIFIIIVFIIIVFLKLINIALSTGQKIGRGVAKRVRKGVS